MKIQSHQRLKRPWGLCLRKLQTHNCVSFIETHLQRRKSHECIPLVFFLGRRLGTLLSATISRILCVPRGPLGKVPGCPLYELQIIMNSIPTARNLEHKLPPVVLLAAFMRNNITIPTLHSATDCE